MGRAGRLGGQVVRPDACTCKSTAKVWKTIDFFVMSAGLAANVLSCHTNRKASTKPRWPVIVQFKGGPMEQLVTMLKKPLAFPNEDVIGPQPEPMGYQDLLRKVRDRGDLGQLDECYKLFVEALETELARYHGVQDLKNTSGGPRSPGSPGCLRFGFLGASIPWEARRTEDGGEFRHGFRSSRI